MKNFFKKLFQNKRTLAMVFGLVLVVGMPAGAHAQVAAVVGAAASAAINNAPNIVHDAVSSSVSDFALGAIIKLLTVPLYLIEMLIAGVLGLSGLLLDTVIKLSVIDLAKHINTIQGINIAWTLIRDLCNMSFIFVLVYEAIMMIFGEGDAKKIITPIIIAALLINFSLFFTKVIIDASNIVTTSFYNSLVQIPQTQVTATGVLSGNNLSESTASTTYTFGLSGAMMSNLHLTSLFGGDTISKSFTATGQNPGPYILSTIGGAVFMLVATFIFLAMTVLFLLRYLFFILLLILSPVGYVSSAIPGLKKVSKQYWDTLLGQALFAPIFMIMMWITLTLSSSAGFLTPQGNISLGAALAQPSTSSMGIILDFALVTGLLIASMVLAKSYATQGGSVMGKIANWSTGQIGNLAFGGAAALGRRTIGKFAESKANDQDLKDRAAAGNKLAQLQLKTARFGAKSTFDTRKGFLGETVGDLTGVNFGKGIPFNAKAGEGGYEKLVKDKKKAEKEYAESLKPSDEVEAEAKARLDDQTFADKKKKEVDTHINDTMGTEINTAKTNQANAKQEKEDADTDVKTNTENIKAVTEKYTKQMKDWENQTIVVDQEIAKNLKEGREKINNIDAEIAKLQKESDSSLIPEYKEVIKAKIKEKEIQREATIQSNTTSANTVAQKKTDLEKTIKDTKEKLAQEKKDADESLKIAKDVAEQKTKAYTEAEKKMTEVSAKETVARTEFIKNDTEFNQVLQRAGGSKGNEKTKTLIALGVKEKDMEDSTKKINVTNYANALATDKTWTRLWRGTPEVNKRLAIEVRKANKSKTKAQLEKELAKIVTEEDGADEKKEEKKEETPKPEGDAH